MKLRKWLKQTSFIYLLAFASPLLASEISVSSADVEEGLVWSCDMTWLNNLKEQFQNEPIASPPRTIYQYKYQNQLVYYVSAPCCDFFSTLYSACGVELCAPDGGITGRGDERCPDFFSTSQNKKLIFRDNRKQLEIRVTNPGTVTSTPTGTNCSDDCIEVYPLGTQVTLTAVPEVGFAFQKWSGNCSGTNATTTITMKADKRCIATFKASGCGTTWLGKLIKQFQDEPVTNPPRSIYQYEYRHQLVYYVPALCCDFFSTLYSACGVELCAPDGGFAGWGDGRCPDFFSTRKNEKLIFQDDRY